MIKPDARLQANAPPPDIIAAHAPSSLFARIFALILAAILLAQAVSSLLQLTLPPQRAKPVGITRIAADIRRGDQQILVAMETPSPPIPEAAERRAAKAYARRLALALDLPPASVIVDPSAPQRGRLVITYPAGSPADGEPMLIGHFRIAIQQEDGDWLVYEPRERPTFDGTERRALLLFLITSIVSLPLAWAFSHRLAIPIEQLADAAERIGRDPSSPPPDISGPREVERAARAVAAMQQRLSDFINERTRMLGAIAHDLRTPLTRLAFRAQALEGPAGEAIRRDLADMGMMVESSLAYVRGADPLAERRPIELGALVEQVASDLTLIGRPVCADIDSSAVVRADPLAIRRILANLMENAAIHGGGAKVRMETMAGNAIVTISDPGDLPPDTDLERLFDPFVCGDPSRARHGGGGTGLGLTVARSLARAHGGDVTLSHSATGTDAKLILPLASAQ